MKRIGLIFRRRITIVLFMIWSFNIYAQSGGYKINVDSVHIYYQQLNDKRQKLEYLKKTAHLLYMSGETDSCYRYSLKGIDLAQELNDSLGMAWLLTEYAKTLHMKNMNDSALIIIHQVDDFLNDNNHKEYYQFLMQNLRFHRVTNNEDSIFHYFNQIKEWCNVHSPYRLWGVYENMFTYLMEGKQYAKAENYIKEAYKITKPVGKRMDHGYLLARYKEYAAVAKDFTLFASLSKEMDELLGTDASKDILHQLSDFEKIEKLTLEDLISLKNEAQKLGHPQGIWNSSMQLGKRYLQMDQPYKGLQVFSDLYKSEIHITNSFEVYDLLKSMYSAARAAGRKSLAAEYAHKIIASQDSSDLLASSQAIIDLEAKYEAEKKQNQIDLLEAENRIAVLELMQNKNQKNILLVALSGFLFIIGGLFYFYRQKSKINKTLEEKNRIINENLEEKELLLKEIHHRVKNNLQVISSLLSLQSRTVDNESAYDALTEGQNRVQSMALIHQHLYRGESISSVTLPEYIRNLCDTVFRTHNILPNDVQLELDIDPIEMDVSMVVPLGLILNELITNACKYAFPKGRNGHLKVCVKDRHHKINVSVTDNGVGKSSESKADGFGTKLIKIFTKKLEAHSSYDYDNGTSFNMEIPYERKIA
jgi:two-component sensor histidine kinase